MTAAKLIDVTLVMAWSPGVAPGEDPPRIVFSIAIDGQGQPDAAAWLADPAPWPARYEAPGKAPLGGDVTHDEDGWSLRFFAESTPPPDVPMHRIRHLGMPRPGEVLTISEPSGAEAAWRVVGIG